MANVAELAEIAVAGAAEAKAAVLAGDENAAWVAVSKACDAAEEIGYAKGEDAERAWVAASEAESAVCLRFMGHDPHA